VSGLWGFLGMAVSGSGQRGAGIDGGVQAVAVVAVTARAGGWSSGDRQDVAVARRGEHVVKLVEAGGPGEGVYMVAGRGSATALGSPVVGSGWPRVHLLRVGRRRGVNAL